MAQYVTVELTAHLSQAVDNALWAIIGQDATTAVYRIVEKRFLLEKNEVPLRLETFSKALFTLFGQQASNMIDKEIAKEFCRRTGIRFDPKANLTTATYTAYVNYAHKFQK